MTSLIESERHKFHEAIFETTLCVMADGVPNFADSSQRASKAISKNLIDLIDIEATIVEKKHPGQTTGNHFEECCRSFVEATFTKLQHLRAGTWRVERVQSRSSVFIAKYEQYAHLQQLNELAAKDKTLKSVLGNDYTIAPDVIVTREPEPDEILNEALIVVGDSGCTHASLRRSNNEHPILHASLSCKWTFRSDRSQNARSEALTLLRNRKGRAPHICVVTAEPTPSRLASVALGTGDLDCVYHFALPELVEAVRTFDGGDGEATAMLDILIEGKRLRDISDLPLDLAI